MFILIIELGGTIWSMDLPHAFPGPFLDYDEIIPTRAVENTFLMKWEEISSSPKKPFKSFL